MKTKLIYYAQFGHSIATKCLYQEMELLIKSLANQAYRKYPYIFSFPELLQMGNNIFYQSLMKYNFYKQASFATFYSMMFHYEIANKVRQSFANKAIVNNFTIKKDYSEFSGNILEDKRTPHPVEISNQDLYYRILNQLTKEDQKLIILWSQGYSYKEIALRYDKKIKWADNKISRILNILRNSTNKSLIK